MEELKNKKEQDPIKNVLYDNLELLFSKLEEQNNRIREIDSISKGGLKSQKKREK